MDGNDVSYSALEKIARGFDGAGDGLSGLDAPPRTPDAGASTGAVAEALAELCRSLGDLLDGMRAADRAVTASVQRYQHDDHAAARAFGGTMRP